MRVLAISGSLRAASINSMLLRVMAYASPRASHAYASLRETITVMSARVIEAASITLPLVSANLSEEAMRADPQICGMLRAALQALKADQ